MKKLIFIPFLFIVFSLCSQDISFKWADLRMMNKKTALSEEFIGANSSTLYTMVSGSKVTTLVSYDRASLSKKKELILKGVKGSVLSNKEYSKVFFSIARVSENGLYLFFKDRTKSSEKILVLELTSDLVVVGGLTTIHEVEVGGRDKNVTYTSIITELKNTSGNIVLVNERTKDDNSAIADYKVFSPEIKLMDAGKIDLPFTKDKKNKSDFIQRSYKLSDNNVLCAITDTKEENPNAPRRNRWTYFTTFTFTDLNSGNTKTTFLKSDAHMYDDLRLVSDGKNLFIAGFYYLPDDDGDFEYVNGFFSTQVNLDKGELSEVKFFEYDENFYRHFKNNQKAEESNRKAKKEEKRAKYIIKKMLIEDIIVKNGEMNVVCSGMDNKAITTCNEKGVCHTRYYCQKMGVIVFTTDASMKVKSYDVLARMMIYDGSNVSDVSIAALKGNSYMINYGSAYELENGAMTGNPKKKDKEIRNTQMEYAILNDEGVLEKRSMKLSKVNGKESKYFEFVERGVVNFNDDVFFLCYFSVDKKRQMAIGKVVEK